MTRLETWLRQPVDNSALIFFRIAYGFLIFLQAAGSIALGFTRRTFVEAQYTFPMVGFEFLRPLFGPEMYAVFALMSVAALLVMVGAWYRLSLTVFTVLWALTYVMQTESYNNHYYLMVLLCLLLLPTPANAWASVDARRHPEIRSTVCPRWCIAQFVLQTLIVYTYASYAKLYPDWLDGRAITTILTNREKFDTIAWLYDEPWLRTLLIWGGILFDGLIGPLLLWRRTRLLALGLSVFFHLFNSITFRIGVFPYTALALTAFFFPGEEVRRLFFRSKPPVVAVAPPPSAPGAWSRLGLAALAVYFALQVAMPLRYLLYPGMPHWTEDGHRMSWRMMLKVKQGRIRFRVHDPATGESWELDPNTRLNDKQRTRVPTHPDMVWLFAQQLKDEYAAQGRPGVEIYADSQVSLNGRPMAPLIRPDVDLARAEWTFFGPLDWVTLSPDGEGQAATAEPPRP